MGAWALGAWAVGAWADGAWVEDDSSATVKVVEFIATPGLTLTAELFPVNSDTGAYSTVTVNQSTNRELMYEAEFGNVTPGTYLLVAYDGTSGAVAHAYTVIGADAGVYRSGSYADVVLPDAVEVMRKILQNRTVTNPAGGVMTVYEDDGTTPALTAQLYENVAQTQTYRGQGAEVRGRLDDAAAGG